MDSRLKLYAAVLFAQKQKDLGSDALRDSNWHP